MKDPTAVTKRFPINGDDEAERGGGEAAKTGLDILVVEHSSARARHLKRLLEKDGHRVRVSPSGEEALRLLPDLKPEVIISGVLRPLIDGYELCRRVKKAEKLKRIPVILLIPFSEVSDIVKGFESGADDIVVSPFRDQILLARLDGLFSASRRVDEPQKPAAIKPGRVVSKPRCAPTDGELLALILSTVEHVLQDKESLAKREMAATEPIETVRLLKKLMTVCSRCLQLGNSA